MQKDESTAISGSVRELIDAFKAVSLTEIAISREVWVDSPCHAPSTGTETRMGGASHPGSEYLFRKLTAETLDMVLSSVPVSDRRRKDLPWRILAAGETGSAVTPGQGRIDQTITAGLTRGERFVLAAAPGSGRTTVLTDVIRTLLRRQMEALASTQRPVVWQLPLFFHARDVRATGVGRTLERTVTQTYGLALPLQVLVPAMRLGFFVPVVDGIEDWGNGDRLSTSDPLVAEFLRLMGPNAPFLVAVDSRCLFYTIFDRDRVTGLGERMRDASDIELFELAPFIGRENGESYRAAFLRQRRELASLRVGEASAPASEDDDPVESALGRDIEAWVGTPDPYGLLSPERRRELVHQLALEQFRSATSALPFDRVMDLVYARINFELRDTFHINALLSEVFQSPIFTGDEERGFNFRSQLIWETALVDLLARTAARDGIGEQFLAILQNGLLLERSALAFWLHRAIRRNTRRFYGRIARILSHDNPLLPRDRSSDPARNMLVGLLRLLVAFDRLSGKPPPLRMPPGVSLEGAALPDMDFADLDLSGWNFNDTVMRMPHFVDSVLEDCSFRNAYIQALLFQPKSTKGVCNFINARLPGAQFTLRAFKDLPLSRADLSGAKIEYAGKGKKSPESRRLRAEIEKAVRSSTITITRDGTRREGGSGFDADLAAALVGVPTLRLVADRFIVSLDRKRDTLRITGFDDTDHKARTASVAMPGTEPVFLTEVRVIGRHDGIEAGFLMADSKGVHALFRDSDRKDWSKPLRLDDRVGTPRFAALLADRGTLLVHGPNGVFMLTDGHVAQALDKPWSDVRLLSVPDTDVPEFIATTDEHLLTLTLAGDAATPGTLTTRIGPRRRLDGNPVRLTAAGEDVALVYDDNSVQMLSRRYGWASRGHHLTSFNSIHDVVFMSERGFLYVIGTWDESAGGTGSDKPLYGSCLLDSRSGDLILYYDLDPKGFDEATLSTDLLSFIRAHERIPDARMSKEEWGEGLYDGSAEGGNFILQRISVPPSQMTYCEGQDLALEIRLTPKDPLSRLRPIYDVPGAVGKMPLRVELQISDAEGVGHAVPTDTVELVELGSDVVVRFPWRFHRSGDYTVAPSVFLGPAMRVLELSERLPVRPNNPYDHGPGLTEGNAYLFVGHEEMLSRLEGDVRRMNVMVCGSRRQGKSSLLNMLLPRLRNIGSGDLVAARVSFDLVEKSDSAGGHSVGVIRALLAGLHRNEEYQRIFALPNPDTITDRAKAKNAVADICQQLHDVLGENARLIMLADEVNKLIDFKDRAEFIGALLNDYSRSFQIVAFGLPVDFSAHVNNLSNSGFPRFLTQRRFLRPLSDQEITALATGPHQGALRRRPRGIGRTDPAFGRAAVRRPGHAAQGAGADHRREADHPERQGHCPRLPRRTGRDLPVLSHGCNEIRRGRLSGRGDGVERRAAGRFLERRQDDQQHRLKVVGHAFGNHEIRFCARRLW